MRLLGYVLLLNLSVAGVITFPGFWKIIAYAGLATFSWITWEMLHRRSSPNDR